MKKTLCNDFLHITVDSLGAELVSVKTADGTDILWQGKEGVWQKHAPLLFPWTGRIKNARFTHNEKSFDAQAHGFISRTEHRCTRETHNSLHFEVCLPPEERERFPYDFHLEQIFHLKNTRLTHTVNITNTGNRPMFFGLGFHPGFICPFVKGKNADDYELRFDTNQSPDLIELTENYLPSGTKKPFMHNQNRIVLSDTLFNNDTICLSGLTASSIKLCEKNGNTAAQTAKKPSLQSIEVGIKDVPYLLLWSAATEKLQFVCIEPWYTLPDFENALPEWETKQNLLRLEAGHTFTGRLPLTFHIK